MSRESEQLPECMMPDGAEPCNAYGKIRKQLDDAKHDIRLLIETCERLRRELDDANGVIR